MRRLATHLSLVVAALAFLGARPARACRVLEIQFNPTAKLQIAIWIERADGACMMNAGPSGTDCIETVFVTRMTGYFGIGNRPGMMDFNSGYQWPYGRRTSVLPVWAHARGHRYGYVVFQDGQDRDLAHSPAVSSLDPFFCRPMLPTEGAVDTTTCATTNPETDKGTFESTGTLFSLYPPRSDLMRDALHDNAAVSMFSTENDIDALSSATPDPSIPYIVRFSMDPLLANTTATDFIVRIEVGKEFDPNGTYDTPSPTMIAYGEYGFAYRGQPSVVWSVPIHVGLAEESWQALDYGGYGPPDGETFPDDVVLPEGTPLPAGTRVRDGTPSVVHPANATIDTTDGSGAGRLLPIDDAVLGPFRLRATFRPSDDVIPPAPVGNATIGSVGPNTATISFVSPGDDGMTGNVSGYLLRLMAGTPMTEANFDLGASPVMRPMPMGGPPGQVVTFALDQLSPNTDYDLGVRAEDDCTNLSSLVVLHFTTRPAPYGTVAPCGCGAAPGASAPTVLVALGLLFVARARRRSHRRDA